MTDVAMYGVSWISEDLKGASHAEDGEAAEVRGRAAGGAAVTHAACPGAQSAPAAVL
jgi:hypothetical protein